MGSKKFDNVDDCARNGADIRIRCSHCRHEIVVNPWRLYAMWDSVPYRKKPLNWNYVTVSQKLKCGQCGAKRPDVTPTAKTR